MGKQSATHCNNCNEELTPFNSAYSGNYRRAKCKECYNKYMAELKTNNVEQTKNNRKGASLKYRYNITVEEYDNLSREQGGVCAVCKKENNVDGRGLTVDHCHTMNVVRGLLCHNCNIALGLLNEDEVIISELLEYIKKYKDRYDQKII